MQAEIDAQTTASTPRHGLGLMAAFLLGLMAVAPLHADQDGDETAPGDLTPLALLLGHIHGKIPGNVLKVELERAEHAGKYLWVYALKLLTPDGDVLKLRYDAKSLQLLQKRGHGRYADGDDHDDKGHGAENQHNED